MFALKFQPWNIQIRTSEIVKKGSYTELLGSPAWETTPLFPEQETNTSSRISRIQSKQRELLVQSLVLSDAMYSEGKAGSLVSPLEKTEQTSEVSVIKEDQHSVSLEGPAVWFLLTIAIRKCCTRWKGYSHSLRVK